MSDLPIQSLVIDCVGVRVRIECDNRDLYRLLEKNFETMVAEDDSCTLYYVINTDLDSIESIVSRRGSDFHAVARNAGEVVYYLESDLVVQLQLLRPGLLFLHSAVLSNASGAHLITGPSGAGKSTTCWGLLHHGFRYMSDELAPVSLQSCSVSDYAHALCLKSAPPVNYPVPHGACTTERGIHIPASAMPSPPVRCELPVRTILFLKYEAKAENIVIEPVRHAEAATRLYPNILNALAHRNDGLDAAVRLTENAACYHVIAADLGRTCALIANVIR